MSDVEEGSVDEQVLSPSAAAEPTSSITDVVDGTDPVKDGEDKSRDFEFTESSYQSYGSKLKNACTGVVVGMLLFAGSIGLLFYNEGRAVARYKDIDEGRENVVEVDLSTFRNDSVVAAENYENKLIYITGSLTTNSSLSDPIFNVSVGEGEALRLQRSVEMYQWTERSQSRQVKTSGGGTRTETTYSYERVWSRSLINSNAFQRQNDGTQNPAALPFESLSLVADPILLGNFIVLSTRVTNLIDWYEPLNDISTVNIPDSQLRLQVTTYTSNGLYYGNGTNQAPQVGDTRIAFYAVAPDTISIIALYRQGRLIPFITSRGGELLLMQRGVYSSEELFVQAEKDNESLTWILRFVGFAIMVISILLILQPMATAVDIIPFVGDCMQGGMEKCIFPTIALLIALPISLFVIALAWCFYRPAIAVPLVAVSLAAIVFLCIRARKKKQEQEEQHPPPQPSTYGQSQQQYGSPYGQPSAPTYSSSQPATGSVPFSQALDAPPPSVSQTYAPSQPATSSTPFSQAMDTPAASSQQTAPTAEPEIAVSSGVYVPSYK